MGVCDCLRSQETRCAGADTRGTYKCTKRCPTQRRRVRFKRLHLTPTSTTRSAVLHPSTPAFKLSSTTIPCASAHVLYGSWLFAFKRWILIFSCLLACHTCARTSPLERGVEADGSVYHFKVFFDFAMVAYVQHDAATLLFSRALL